MNGSPSLLLLSRLSFGDFLNWKPCTTSYSMAAVIYLFYGPSLAAGNKITDSIIQSVYRSLGGVTVNMK